MSILDGFALVVLFILLGTVLSVWIGLGMAPGRIARKRNHPQADAINVCGWFGVITMGLLIPLAFIWAYTDADQSLFGRLSNSDRDKPAEEGAQSCSSFLRWFMWRCWLSS